MQKIKRGDIYYADLNPVVGSEQGDYRPILVVQNNTGNLHSPTIVVAPITRKLRRNPLPTHVLIPKSCGLDKDSLVLTEQIRTIDRSRLAGFIGRIDDKMQSVIDKALAVSVGLGEQCNKKTEPLVLTLCPRCEANFRDSGYLLIKKGWQEIKEDCDYCDVHKGLTFGIFKSNTRGDMEHIGFS